MVTHEGARILGILLLMLTFSMAPVEGLVPSAEASRLSKAVRHAAKQIKKPFVKARDEIASEACDVGFNIARDGIQGSGTAMPLSKRQRAHLNRGFADLIGRVTFRYGAKMQRVRITVQGKILYETIPADGQTFGHTVYVKGQYAPDDATQLRLLTHELTHVRQVERGDFGSKYCNALVKANFTYSRNAMEQEAYAAEYSP